MGIPYIDIYVLTTNRDKETIERFLAEFTDREAIEDRGDGELMILPKGKASKQVIDSNEYCWVKAHTVTHSIEIGLSEPDTCFTMYLASNKRDIEFAIVTFTQDAKLILGLSIFEYKDDAQTLDNYKIASTLADSLFENYNGLKSYIGLEASPADNEAEFDKEMGVWSGSTNFR